MQHCINELLKNNNEIMQYYIINNDIALIMHYRALLQMPVWESLKNLIQQQTRVNDITTDPSFTI